MANPPLPKLRSDHVSPFGGRTDPCQRPKTSKTLLRTALEWPHKRTAPNCVTGCLSWRGNGCGQQGMRSDALGCGQKHRMIRLPLAGKTRRSRSRRGQLAVAAEPPSRKCLKSLRMSSDWGQNGAISPDHGQGSTGLVRGRAPPTTHIRFPAVSRLRESSSCKSVR
jgi:hypothetical protein